MDTLILANAMLFLSTLSLRRATVSASASGSTKPNFYPRSPCGERQVDTLILANTMLFLSTLSLRRATIRKCQIVPIIQISIHALLAESDLIPHMERLMEHLFLSTLSLRRATMTEGSICFDSKISIHALLAESDR